MEKALARDVFPGTHQLTQKVETGFWVS